MASISGSYKARLGSGAHAIREAAHAPPDRAHVDDPAAAAAQRREQRLRHRDMADEVDLELAPEHVERQQLDRAGLGGPGVVDEAVEARWAGRSLDLGGGGL